MSFTPVLVFGKYVGVNDQPASGSVTLTLSDPISDGVTTITPSQSITAALDATGSVAFVWPANDDPTTEPVGTSTLIAPSLVNAKFKSFSGVITHSGLTTLVTGTGAPSSGTGSNGNWYLDTAGGLVYGPKVAGAWPTAGTFVTDLNGQTPAGVLDLAAVPPALSGPALYSGGGGGGASPNQAWQPSTAYIVGQLYVHSGTLYEVNTAYTSGSTFGSTDTSNSTAITGGASGVSSFNTRSGAVTLTKADVTGTGLAASDVSADISGAASTAQTNAESFATSSVATEITRAEAAEALLAPKASPTFTGTVTVPTPTAGDNTTKAASTAFVTTAVAAGGVSGGPVSVTGTTFTSNAYTFVLGDAEYIQLGYNGGSAAATYTVPTFASVAFPLGTVLSIVQSNTSYKMKVAAASGVTIWSSISGGFVSGTTGTRAEYSTIALVNIGTNLWLMSGDAA
jgi:hypothetical protein